jgi:glutaredoxin
MITMKFKMSIMSLTLLAVLLFALPVVAEMHKWIDENGITQYSDTPPNNQPTLEIRGNISSYATPSVEALSEDFFDHLDKPARGKRVIMYSAEWCGVCKRAKTYFQRKSVPYAERDIDKSKKARAGYDKLNGKGVPVILVGKIRLNGFSEKRFEQIYYN